LYELVLEDFQVSRQLIEKMVGLGRFELPTHGLGNRCSIHLSYRPEGRSKEVAQLFSKGETR
jgi:hypothetical protein